MSNRAVCNGKEEKAMSARRKKAAAEDWAVCGRIEPMEQEEVLKAIRGGKESTVLEILMREEITLRELLGLRVEDVQPELRQVKIRPEPGRFGGEETEGLEGETLRISGRSMQLLEKVIRARRKQYLFGMTSGTVWGKTLLFSDVHGRIMSFSRYGKILEQIGEKIGRKITPGTLSRTVVPDRDERQSGDVSVLCAGKEGGAAPAWTELPEEAWWPEEYRRPWKYRSLNEDEQRKIMALDSGAVEYAFLQVKMITGMRTGEILGLCWEDVNSAGRRISVRRQLSGNGTAKLIKSTKNFRQRTIGVPAVVIGILEGIRGKTEGKRCGKYDFVFCDGDGDPLKAADMNELLRKVVGRKKARLHELRVTAATVMYEVTSEPRAAADLLGHLDMGVTVEHYIDERRNNDTGAIAQDVYYRRMHERRNAG